MAIEVKPLTDEGKARIEGVLQHAASDIKFRELLMEDPTAALVDTDLTDDEKAVLGKGRRVALEEYGVDVRSFRSFLLDNGNKLTPGDVIDPI